MENRIKTLLEFFLLIVLHVVCFLRCGRCSTAIYGSRGALRLRRNSENFGCGVKVTHFRAFYWKIPWNKWNFERYSCFSVGPETFPVEMRFPFRSFPEDSSAKRQTSYSRRYLCRCLGLWRERNKWNLFQKEHAFHPMDHECPLAFLCPRRGLFWIK